MSIDALLHRCDAKESCIPPEFIAKLSKDQKKLFDSLCPHLRAVVAKVGTQIITMGDGHIIKHMIETIDVSDVHTLLPLTQRDLAELLGVSPWSILKTFKNIVRLERWPAREYSAPARLAARLDKNLASASRIRTIKWKKNVAARLNKHLETYSGLHICGAINRFREVGTVVGKDRKHQRSEKRLEINLMTQNDGRPQISEYADRIKPATQSDRKRRRSDDLPEINQPMQSTRKRQRSSSKKETSSSAS